MKYAPLAPFGLVLVLLLFAPVLTIPDPCPVDSPTWIEFDSLPDSLQAPPDFFFEKPTVPVHHLIICKHGVFFNFHAMNQGVSTEYYFSFPVPTYEEYEGHVPLDTLMSLPAIMDTNYVRRKVEAGVVTAAAAYDQCRRGLRQLLAERYAEGRRIELDGTTAQLRLDFELAFLWDDRSISFHTYPGIYRRR